MADVKTKPEILMNKGDRGISGGTAHLIDDLQGVGRVLERTGILSDRQVLEMPHRIEAIQ